MIISELLLDLISPMERPVYNNSENYSANYVFRTDYVIKYDLIILVRENERLWEANNRAALWHLTE